MSKRNAAFAGLMLCLLPVLALADVGGIQSATTATMVGWKGLLVAIIPFISFFLLFFAIVAAKRLGWMGVLVVLGIAFALPNIDAILAGVGVA